MKALKSYPLKVVQPEDLKYSPSLTLKFAWSMISHHSVCLLVFRPKELEHATLTATNFGWFNLQTKPLPFDNFSAWKLWGYIYKALTMLIKSVKMSEKFMYKNLTSEIVLFKSFAS